MRLYVLANSAKLCQKGVKLNFNSFLQDGNIFWKGAGRITGSHPRPSVSTAEAQEPILPEDIGMSGFHVRKHHTGEDVLAARSFIAPFVKPLPPRALSQSSQVQRIPRTAARLPDQSDFGSLCKDGEKT